jgi:SAM-dependent methyltransferase
MDASYRNAGHYLLEPWRAEPKRYFRAVIDRFKAKDGTEGLSVLDVGCATGEFLAWVHKLQPNAELFGVDVDPTLVAAARQNVPAAKFSVESALSLPEETFGQFDVVTLLGVLGVFDAQEAQRCVQNVVKCARPGGRALLFCPVNDFGVDIIVRHRKRPDGLAGPWELGWNIFSEHTLREFAEGHRVTFHPFDLGLQLEPHEDPVRTWTTTVEGGRSVLTNGLKLLLDFAIVEIEA